MTFPRRKGNLKHSRKHKMLLLCSERRERYKLRGLQKFKNGVKICSFPVVMNLRILRNEYVFPTGITLLMRF